VNPTGPPPLDPHERTRRGFLHLKTLAESGDPFTVDAAVAATGWSTSSVTTYRGKKWRD